MFPCWFHKSDIARAATDFNVNRMVLMLVNGPNSDLNCTFSDSSTLWSCKQEHNFIQVVVIAVEGGFTLLIRPEEVLESRGWTNLLTWSCSS